MKTVLPILTVVATIVVLWYAAAIPMNAQWARDQAARADTTLNNSELIA
ncbi:MAG TPA: ABC transporter permease, partial [Rhodobacteraceae bacterium]|nr:ABC transporter permease [Paracoccaceae bacterium]